MLLYQSFSYLVLQLFIHIVILIFQIFIFSTISLVTLRINLYSMYFWHNYQVFLSQSSPQKNPISNTAPSFPLIPSRNALSASSLANSMSSSEYAKSTNSASSTMSLGNTSQCIDGITQPASRIIEVSLPISQPAQHFSTIFLLTLIICNQS